MRFPFTFTPFTFTPFTTTSTFTPFTTTSIFFFFLVLPMVILEDPIVDVALSKPVSASLTCGFQGSERFFSQLHTGTQSSANQQVCFNTTTYPAQHINDGTVQTWWQSTSRLSFIGAGFGIQGKPDAVINIDLQQEFQAEVIALQLGESLRPGRMIFYRQTNTGPMIEWFYRVTSAMDCQNFYNLPVSTLPTQLDSTPCTSYSGPAVLEEVVQFDFSRTPANMKEWNKVNSIRIEFYNIDLTLGVSSGSNEFQHYTVRSVKVLAKCSCNGQLTDCVVNNVTKRYECVCGGFTMGEFCQLCHPLYHNKPYQFGVPCQKCNCNNQSDSCLYDATRLTGVCNACRNSTSGLNCETCNDGFYRPTGVLATDPNPCQPCVCSGAYTTGECLKTANPILNPGMSPGDCICKPNVGGQLCDRCNDGYYDISVIGCRDCLCQTNGTTAGSKSCGAGGQCSCKKFTAGVRCDECITGYFNMAPANPDGCIACNCDLGGSVSGECDKGTGGCRCRLGVEGRTCDTPIIGYYYPEFHHFSAEMENLNSPWQKTLTDYSGFGYVSPLNQIPASTTIDLTGINQITPRTFRIVLRYFSSVDVMGTIGIGTNNAISETYPLQVGTCSGRGQWCFVPSEQVTLNPGTLLKVSFTFPTIPANAKLSLDRVSAVPSPFFNASEILGPTGNSEFLANCNVLINNLNSNAALRKECSKYVFSISTTILNGALLCSCSGVGANASDSCNLNGGQCFCKPFVTGRSCSQCASKYYSLSPSGCSACNCSSTSYDMCDPITGVCLCPPGAQGSDCSTCKLNYYDWDRVRGCLPCGCNQMGSTTLACDTATGTCSCKAGVMGMKCDQCQDGYWKLSFLGCGRCSCDVKGSISNKCDKTNGACQCKENVQGQWCNTCKLNSFSMTSYSLDGCLKCSCMGISTTCSPSNLINPSFPLNPFSASVTLVDKFGKPYVATTPTIDPDSEMATANIPALADVYWSLPAIKGDILYLYGLRISWNVAWKSVDSTVPAVFVQNPAIIVVGRNDEQFIFQIANFTTPPSGQTTSFHAKLVLTSIDDFLLSKLSREKILVGLSDVKAFMIPAVYKRTVHESSIGSIELLLDPSLVEGCLCPRGYEGRSCERCSVGFTRVNVSTQGYLGNCAPCSCNGKATTCDASTGECSNCQSFTTGFSCNKCLHGYYRDPTDGGSGSCLKCPCEGPRVQTNDCAFVNNTLTCLNCTIGYKEALCNLCEPDYYGDLSVSLMNSCRACLCNNRSNTCNLFGVCQNCTNFSTGDNCESCLPGKFKDAATLDCIDCSCNTTGSETASCDVQTGLCACKPGVSSRTCGQCSSNFYEFSATGCTECMCNVHGSETLQCKQDGVCVCRNNTSSIKCDTCLAGFYGIINNKPCELCACDPLGTDSTKVFECDLLTGQCACKPNVVGRRCEMCKPLFYSVPEILDCINCGQCETSLGSDIISMENNAESNFIPLVSSLNTIFSQDTELATEQQVLDTYCSSLGNCKSNDNLYDQFKSNVSILMVQSKQWKSRADAMDLQARALSVVLHQLNNESHVLLETVQALKQQADQVRRDYASQIFDSHSDISRLTVYNDSAHILWQGSPYNGSTFVALPWTHGTMFDPEKRWISDLIARATALATRADTLNIQLNELVQQTTSIQATVQASQDLFTSTSSEIQQLNTTISDMLIRLRTLTLTINNIVNIKASADSNFQRVKNIVLLTGASLQATASSLVKCQQTLIQTTNLIHGNWTTKPTVYDETGFRGWSQGYFLVNQLLQSAQASFATSQTRISPSEVQTVVLANKAAAIRSAYDAVKSKGQAAVDVIQKFEGVIKDLEESIAQASTINVTLQALLSHLNSVPVAQLLSQASQVLTTANQLKNNIGSVINSTNSIDLNNQLDTARSRFQSSVGVWTSIDQRLEAFRTQYQDLQNFINDLTPKLGSDYDKGMVNADAVKVKMNGVEAQHNNFVSGLDRISLSIDNVSESVTQSYATQNKLAANMSNFRVQLDQAAQTSLTDTNTTQTTISSMREGLENKFTKVDEMLRQIQAQIAAMEHPVFFPSNTFEQAANPDVNSDQLHNSISFQFMFSQTSRGVLFFVENNLSNEKLLVQLINSTVCFAVGNLQVDEMVCNYAQLNAREWYKVYATRYGMDLKLTVIRHSTGGAVVVSIRSSLTSVLKVTLNSPVYIGGLALNAKNIQKVYDSGVGFNGCIYKVSFNGAPIPIWQNLLKTDSTATCCKNPPATTFEATITPCTTFYGFGHVIYNQSPSFNINPGAQISLHFRTFMPHGVLFLVSSFASQDFYGVFLQNGRILFSISTQNVPLSVTSDLTYNNGKWYQLTVTHTTTKLSLRLDSGEGTPANMEFKESTGLIALSSLNNVPFILGGQHPNFVRGPVTDSFSGHVKELKHTTLSSSTPVTSQTSVNSSLNVDLTSCLAEVTKGLGLLPSAYVTVLPSVSPIQIIDFAFITTQLSGILIYTPLEQTPTDLNTFLYIALYNGDIFLLFNQGGGVQPATRTRNLYLADGRRHRVSLHFGFVNSPRMKVDNLETHVGAVSMNAYMKLRENKVYVGGVPSSISLDTNVLPVEEAFVGGMEEMKINDVNVPFLENGVVTKINSKQVDLSGIMLSRKVAQPPCNPCPTAPSTVSCITPPPPSSHYDQDTFNFADSSYLQYSIAAQESTFVHGFVFQLKFKSLQPDGLIVYLANTPASFLTDYYAIFLHRGYINAVLMNANIPKAVVSKKTYYDGDWHSLSVFRVGDFMAILVEDSFDYNNNNQDSSIRLPMTNFVINSPLYVGGVPLNIPIFPASIPIGKTSFKGCIAKIVIQSHNYEALDLPISKITHRMGVGLCSVGKKLGMFMASSNSFVRAADAYNPSPVYNLAPSFTISLTFKTSSQNGVLMVAWSSSASFVSLSLVNGEFHVILGSPTQPFVFISNAFKTVFDVCNNEFRTIELSIETTSISLTLDNTHQESKQFNGFIYSPPLSVPIYLGGVKDSTWSIPNLFSGNSLSGCIQKCIINQVLIYITQSPELKNALSGCN